MEEVCVCLRVTSDDFCFSSYLVKYGDIHERLQTIKNEHQNIKDYQLPRLQSKLLNIHIQPSTSMKKSVADSNNWKFHDKCDPSLPLEDCFSSKAKPHFPIALSQIDLNELEKLMQAEVVSIDIYSKNSKCEQLRHQIYHFQLILLLLPLCRFVVLYRTFQIIFFQSAINLDLP